MKGSVKIALIVAACLCVAGVAMGAVGIFAMGSDIGGAFSKKYEAKEYEIKEAFEGISVNVYTDRVSLLPSRDNTVRVECEDMPRVGHSVKVKDGVLTVEMEDSRRWYDHIGIYWKETRINIYLPEGSYRSLHVDTDTGDLDVPEGYSFGEVYIKSDTGDISFKGDAEATLEIVTHTGDVDVPSKHSFGAVSIKTDTGDISFFANVSEGLEIGTHTGDIELEGAELASVAINSQTGDVLLRDIKASGLLSVTTDTGDVELEGADGGSIRIKTATGDVTGSLLTGKLFSADSDTGRIRVPADSPDGGRCEITTSTGDIEIIIK